MLLTANSDAGVTYSWSTSAISQTIDVSPNATTEYTVTVTDYGYR